MLAKPRESASDGRLRRRGVIKRYAVPAYFILTFAVAWAGCSAVILPKFLGHAPILFADLALVALPMFFAPTLVGVSMTYLCDGTSGLKELASRMKRWRVGPRWYLPLSIFPAMILVSLAALNVTVSPHFMPYVFPEGIVIGLIAGYLEEIGWMGFAFPRMQSRFGTFKSAVFIGLLQTTWHFAADFLGASGSRGAYWLPHFLLFITSMMAMRVLLVWVYVNTKSVLMAQLMHASSTGFLSVLVPLSLSPAEDTLFYLVYSIVLILVVVLVLSEYGHELNRRSPNAGRRVGNGIW